MWNPFRRKKKQESAGSDLVFGKYEYGQETKAPVPGEVQPMAREVSYELREVVEVPGEIAGDRDRDLVLAEDRITLTIKKTIRGLLLALVALVPVFFLTVTAPGDVLVVNKQALIYSIAMASFILWLVIIVRQGGVGLKLSGLEWGILTWLGAWLVATLFSAQIFRSFVATNGFVIFASGALLWFILLHFFEERDIGRLVDYFLLGSGAAILGGVLVLYKVPVFGWVSSISKELVVGDQFNTVGSFNALGALAAVAMVLALSKFFNSWASSEEHSDVSKFKYLNIWWGVVRWSVVILATVLLLILNWWVFYVAVAVGMLAATLSVRAVEGKTNIKLRAVNVILPLAVLVLALLLIFSAKYLGFSFPGRQNLTTEVSLTQGASFDIFKKVFNQRPVFGMGPDNFHLAYDQFKPASINNTIFWNVRFTSTTSEFMNLLTQGGVVAAAAFGVLLFYIFRRVIIKERFGGPTSGSGDLEDRPPNKPNGSLDFSRWLVVPPLMATLALFFLYPFNIVLYFAFWFLLALLAVAISSGRERRQILMSSSTLSSFLPALAFVLVFALSLVGGYLLFQRYLGEFSLARAARLPLNNRENLERATELLARAIANDRSDVKYLNNLGQVLLARIRLEAGNRADQPEEVDRRLQNLSRAVIDIASQMVSEYKNDSASYWGAGSVYQSLIGIFGGADEAAVAAYREFVKRSTADPMGYVRMGAIYLNRADRNNSALAEARRRRLGVRNEKEVIDKVISDYKSAEENFKKATELKRDLAVALYNLGIVYERENRIKEAIKQLELTAARELRNPGLAFELGLLYYRDGQKDRALQEMARAVALFRDYSNARWYLALMLEERGQIDLAIGQLKEILKLEVNKDSPVVLEKLAALEAGRREIPPAKVTGRQPIEGRVPRQR